LADYDVRADTLPQLAYPGRGAEKPTIAAMKTALDTHNATSYRATRLNTMTYNDLLYACQLHGLSVVGI
jgi:hypothetical protein